jgi:DNA invertase Pin-like site-specific DNA recombinase
MLDFTKDLRGAGLRVLNLGGGDVDTATPMGSMPFTIKRERVVDSIAKYRAAGKDLGGRPRIITDSQIRNARRLIEGGEIAAQVSLDLGMSRATFYRRAVWDSSQTLISDNAK